MSIYLITMLALSRVVHGLNLERGSIAAFSMSLAVFGVSAAFVALSHGVTDNGPPDLKVGFVFHRSRDVIQGRVKMHRDVSNEGCSSA